MARATDVMGRVHPMLDREELIVVADEAAVVRITADQIATALAEAVAERGRVDWATTGGSLAAPVFRALADPPRRDAVPWRDVHVWWGDDRFVPHDHPLSNVKAVDDILVDRDHGVPIPFGQLHPFRTTQGIADGGGPEWTATALADELHAAGIPTADGFPVFDLVQLGLGGDGHLLSVFPGSAAFDSDAWTLAIPAPTHIEPHVERVTMNPAVVRVGRRVVMAVAGAGKADVLGEIFGPTVDPQRWPAQLARRAGATWVLDEAAAARILR